VIAYPSLVDAGATVAAMSGISDGDCGWGGVESGDRARFLVRAGVPADRLVALRQCHGDVILAIGPEQAGSGAGGSASALAEADGLMTCHAGIPLGIMVADCVPVFLATHEAVAVVHAGRVGTQKRIASKAVELLCRTYAVEPSAVFALIGPSAGPCCYEVSPEICHECAAVGMHHQGNYLDLWQSNQRQLLEAGLQPTRISISGHCTICQPGYHSYRGHRTEKRNLALIMR